MKKQKKLKKNIRYFLVFTIFLFLIINLLIFAKNLIAIKNEKGKLLYSYNINQNIDYTVNLYENSFIEEKSLNKNQTYITSLVEKIDINYVYDYNASKEVELYYDTKIYATIKGDYQTITQAEKNNIWQKKYIIEEQINNKIVSNHINYKKSIPIDINEYISIVQSFKNQLKLPIIASLELEINIEVRGKINEQPINDVKKVSISIPLDEQIFKITEIYLGKSHDNIYEKEFNISVKNINEIIISLVIIMIISIIILKNYKILFNIKEISRNQKIINRYLKKYGEIIVEATSKINEMNHTIINIKNFNELLDLEEELRIPILLYNDILEKKYIFTIEKDDIIYKYEINI